MRNSSVPVRFIFLIIVGILAAAVRPVSAVPRSCESLAQLALPNTKITVAQTVTAREFTPPGSRAIKDLPAFCRVARGLCHCLFAKLEIIVEFEPETITRGKP